MSDSPGSDKQPSGLTPDRLGLRFRRHFLTGILVVTPAAVAAWVLYRLLAWVDGLLWAQVRFGWVRPGGIPGAGLVTVVLLVLLVGILVNNYVGRRFYQVWDHLLTRIPLFNKIYIAVKQIAEALLSRNRTVFRSVGMIQYPRKGLWCLVFLTEHPGPEIQNTAGEKLRSVFLPTTPNPTSGFLLMVPEKDITELSMSVEDGLKMVISGGAFVPHEGDSWFDEVDAGSGERRRRWWRRPRRTARPLPAPSAEGGPRDAAGPDASATPPSPESPPGKGES